MPTTASDTSDGAAVALLTQCGPVRPLRVPPHAAGDRRRTQARQREHRVGASDPLGGPAFRVPPGACGNTQSTSHLAPREVAARGTHLQEDPRPRNRTPRRRIGSRATQSRAPTHRPASHPGNSPPDADSAANLHQGRWAPRRRAGLPCTHAGQAATAAPRLISHPREGTTRRGVLSKDLRPSHRTPFRRAGLPSTHPEQSDIRSPRPHPAPLAATARRRRLRGGLHSRVQTPRKGPGTPDTRPGQPETPRPRPSSHPGAIARPRRVHDGVRSGTGHPQMTRTLRWFRTGAGAALRHRGQYISGFARLQPHHRANVSRETPVTAGRSTVLALSRPRWRRSTYVQARGADAGCSLYSHNTTRKADGPRTDGVVTVDLRSVSGR